MTTFLKMNSVNNVQSSKAEPSVDSTSGVAAMGLMMRQAKGRTKRSKSKKTSGRSMASKRSRDPSTGRYLPMPKRSMSKKSAGKSMSGRSMAKKSADKSIAGKRPRDPSTGRYLPMPKRSMSKKRAGKSMAGEKRPRDSSTGKYMPKKSSSSKRRRHPKTGRFYLSKQPLLAEANTKTVKKQKKPVAAPHAKKNSK